MRVLLLLGDMKPHAWVATSAIALKNRLAEVLARLAGLLCGAGAAGTRAWSPAKKVATILPLLPALPPALARAVSVGRPRVAPAGWSASADPCCPTEASWRPQHSTEIEMDDDDGEDVCELSVCFECDLTNYMMVIY